MNSRREDQSAPPCARGTGKGGETSQRGCGNRVLCARGGCRAVREFGEGTRARGGWRARRAHLDAHAVRLDLFGDLHGKVPGREVADGQQVVQPPDAELGKRLLPRHANHLVQSEHGVAPRLGRLREFRQLRRPALTVPHAYGGGSRAGRRDTRHADARDGCGSAASSDPADVPRDPSFVRAGGRDDWRKCDQRQFLVFRARGLSRSRRALRPRARTVRRSFHDHLRFSRRTA